jgi:hypothetical protein
MSLPIAPKDIGDHPAKGSVVDPIDRNAKEADVDRKVCCVFLRSCDLRSHMFLF